MKTTALKPRHQARCGSCVLQCSSRSSGVGPISLYLSIGGAQFLGLHFKLTTDFRKRFTSEFLFSYRCVSQTLIQITCLHIVFRPRSKRSEHHWAAWYLSCLDSQGRRNRLQGKSPSRSTDSAEVLAPSCPWISHARLISLDCDFVSSVHQCYK